MGERATQIKTVWGPFLCLSVNIFKRWEGRGEGDLNLNSLRKLLSAWIWNKKFHRRCIQKIWTKSKLEQFFSQLVQLFCNFTGLNRKKIEKVSFGKHLCVFNCFTVINQLSLSFTISKIIPVRAVLPPYKPVMSSTVNSLLFKGHFAVNARNVS